MKIVVNDRVPDCDPDLDFNKPTEGELLGAYKVCLALRRELGELVSMVEVVRVSFAEIGSPWPRGLAPEFDVVLVSEPLTGLKQKFHARYCDFGLRLASVDPSEISKIAAKLVCSVRRELKLLGSTLKNRGNHFLRLAGERCGSHIYDSGSGVSLCELPAGHAGPCNFAE